MPGDVQQQSGEVTGRDAGNTGQRGRAIQCCVQKGVGVVRWWLGGRHSGTTLWGTDPGRHTGAARLHRTYRLCDLASLLATHPFGILFPGCTPCHHHPIPAALSLPCLAPFPVPLYRHPVNAVSTPSTSSVPHKTACLSPSCPKPG